jgi:Recombination endonuclease VII
MCKGHYERWRKRDRICTVPGCGNQQFAKTWCNQHYSRWRRHGDVEANPKRKHPLVCKIDGCDESTYRSGRGMCRRHYLAWYRETRPVPPSTRDHRPYSRKYILKQYGLTPEDYERMLTEQGGLCAVCRTDTPGRGKPSWNVDHDHETGAVRGLLCHNCNMALGMLGDCVETAQALVSYLLAHRGGDA